LQHPFSKINSVKSRVVEDFFKQCGKQEKGVVKSIPFLEIAISSGCIFFLSYSSPVELLRSVS